MAIILSLEHKRRTTQELIDLLEQKSDCQCVTEYGHNSLCPYAQMIARLTHRQTRAGMPTLRITGEPRG